MASTEPVTSRLRFHLRRGAVIGVVATATGTWMVTGGLAAASTPPVPQLSVLAGTGTAGPVTPGPADKSELDGSFGDAVDSLGDVFIADAGNNEVEEVSPAGILSVVAGTGTAGPSAPGPAKTSELDYPDGVALDGLGDLFIADAGNAEVEEVSPSGILSVVAGTGTPGTPTPGPANESQISLPYGIALDRLGDLYIADSNNNVVEKVSAAGTLSVFAGTGTGGTPTAGPATSSDLDFPAGVAVDGLGDVYIADTFNSEVEKVSPKGTLSVFAGTGNVGLPKAGPARSSRLNHPYGVGVDTAGNVYIADTFNSEVEEVNPSGTLAVIAGTGTAGKPTPGPASASELRKPSGVSADGLGNLYVADDKASEVDRITAPQGGSATVGIAAPASGGYLQATASGHVSTHGTTFHGSPFSLGLTSPVAGIAATSAGDYFVATASGHVYNYGTPSHGSPYSDDLTSPVVGMATTANGYLVVTAAGHVYAYATPSHGSPVGDDLTSPVVGIAATSAGGYFVATAAGGIYAYDAADHGSPKSKGVQLTSAIVGIATTPDGYVEATASGQVYNYGTPFYGSPSASNISLTAPITGITATSGGGYELTTSAGTVYNYAS